MLTVDALGMGRAPGSFDAGSRRHMMTVGESGHRADERDPSPAHGRANA